MICSDTTIREQIDKGRIVIDPKPQDWQFQPASVDLTLGSEFMSPYTDKKYQADSVYTLMPRDCVLATTAEYIEVPDDMVARVEGKSSWGRRFVLTHATAGYIDPGFKGQITLELHNLSEVNQVLKVGCAIAQISFHLVDQPVRRPYGSPDLGSHYQNQKGATPSALPWR